MKYMACVRDKITKKIEIITMDYPTKKAFAEDIRANGYGIRFISTPEKFDEDCEKYHRSCEKTKAHHKVKYDCEKRFAAEHRMTIKQYRAWIKEV